MSSIKCIIVDDEANARNLIAEYCQSFPFLEVEAQVKNAFEAIEVLNKGGIDLMFLDIQMPGMLGTTLLSSLPQKPISIFTTAYENFAIESYDLQAFDYLLKPISLERFSKAVFKAQEFHTLLKSDGKKFMGDQPYIFVNVEYALVKIMVNDILYIEGLKDYIKIFIKDRHRPILTKSTLKGIEEKLPSGQFLRVHKSFIVNVQKVESIKAQRVKIGEMEIPVSDINLDELLVQLKIK